MRGYVLQASSGPSAARSNYCGNEGKRSLMKALASVKDASKRAPNQRLVLRCTIKKFWGKETRRRYRPTVKCRRPSIGKPGDTSSAESLRFGLCLHKARPQRIRPPPRAATRLGTAKLQRDLGQYLPLAPSASKWLQEPLSMQAMPVSPLAWSSSSVPWPSSWRASSQLSFSWPPLRRPFSWQASAARRPSSSQVSSLLPLARSGALLLLLASFFLRGFLSSLFLRCHA